MPLKHPILIAFTPVQLHRLGGFNAIKQFFTDWKNRNPNAKNVFLMLDHATSVEMCFQAIDHQFDMVMFDGSHLSFTENLKLTKKIVTYAHQKNVLVEAELGKLNWNNYAKTEIDQVKTFTTKTGVDFLAVAVGNYHGLTKKPVEIDWILLKKLRNESQAKLVFHGASGVSQTILQKLISQQLIAKINFDSDLQKQFLLNWPTNLNSFDYHLHYQIAFQAVLKYIQKISNDLITNTKKWND